MKKIKNIFIILSIVVLTVLILGFWKTTGFSAYGACRKLAMQTKGYGVWRHESTTQDGFQSHVSFSDGYNIMTCSATGIGPFWVATSYSRTLVGCNQSLGTASDPCPEDYFGVEP